MTDTRHPTAKKIDELLERMNRELREREAEILAHAKANPPPPEQDDCDHGVHFPPEGSDAERVILQHLSAAEVRECFPRLFGTCPLGCGYNGIYYTTFAHMIAGDW
jgi:hypothetical protein